MERAKRTPRRKETEKGKRGGQWVRVKQATCCKRLPDVTTVSCYFHIIRGGRGFWIHLFWHNPCGVQDAKITVSLARTGPDGKPDVWAWREITENFGCRFDPEATYVWGPADMAGTDLGKYQGRLGPIGTLSGWTIRVTVEGTSCCGTAYQETFERHYQVY